MKLTPLYQQYRAIKEQQPDAILMFRLGDFYEMFGEDARMASSVLEIVLTNRDFGQGFKLPMCGIPHHAADNYIARLVESGHKVAIAEQLEEATAGKLVNRDVTRVITPGTYLDADRLDADRNNYLISIVNGPDRFGFGVIDVSTGEFSAGDIARDSALNALFREVDRLTPRECIIVSQSDDSALKEKITARYPKLNITGIDPLFDPSYHRDRLCAHFSVGSLRGFGLEDHPLAIMAAGHLLDYVRDNLRSDPRHVQSVSLYVPHAGMYLDPTTRRNLELTETLREKEKKGSLLWVIDRTVTPMGKRRIRSWLEQPLTDPAQINRRLDAVAELVDNRNVREGATVKLREIRDLERLSSRIATMLITPRELLAVRDSIAALPGLFEELSQLSSALYESLREDFDLLEDVRELLTNAISEDAPRVTREGGIIRDGFSPEVDTLREAKRDGRKWIAELEESERRESGIKNLKIGFNNVFGYYIEVTKSNFGAVPDRYTRRQTLANCERYITQELKEKETAILGAESRLNDLENRLFCEIRDSVSDRVGRILRTSNSVAALDVLVSLATVAAENGYCRPSVSNSETIEIDEGRHPVLDLLMPPRTFIPNDTRLSCSGSQIHIITGPNMAGKSTYMRQTALLVLLAQSGSFVPARSADIGVVDRIFTRVGAVDDISLGLSTFMVEMVETSLILNNATKRSLILLDEVGRGTSTTDGVSIAWAVTEYIHERIGARTLFATHFNELTLLADKFERIENFHVTAYEKGSDIVFTHRLRQGSTDRSFGIEVARLAGVPASVTRRAQEILSSQIEQRELVIPDARVQQLSLIPSTDPNRVEELLRGINPEELSPKRALDILFQLKELINDSSD